MKRRVLCLLLAATLALGQVQLMFAEEPAIDIPMQNEFDTDAGDDEFLDVTEWADMTYEESPGEDQSYTEEDYNLDYDEVVFEQGDFEDTSPDYEVVENTEVSDDGENADTEEGIFYDVQDEIPSDESDFSEETEVETNDFEIMEFEDIVWTNKGEFPFVTSVIITDEDGNDASESTFDKDGGINLRFEFAIPNDADVQKGDVYTIQIPDGFELIGDIAEQQLDPASGIDATWEVVDGIIIIRMYQDFDTLSNVTGYMNIGCWFDKNSQIGEGGNTITFEIAGNTYTVNLYHEEITDAKSAQVSKTGWVTDSETGEILWRVIVKPDSDTATLAGVTISDTYDGSLQTMIADSITVNDVSVSDGGVQYNSNGFEYTFPEGTTPGEKVIAYRTKVTREYLYNSTATINYGNPARSNIDMTLTVGLFDGDLIKYFGTTFRPEEEINELAQKGWAALQDGINLSDAAKLVNLDYFDEMTAEDISNLTKKELISILGEQNFAEMTEEELDDLDENGIEELSEVNKLTLAQLGGYGFYTNYMKIGNTGVIEQGYAIYQVDLYTLPGSITLPKGKYKAVFVLNAYDKNKNEFSDFFVHLPISLEIREDLPEELQEEYKVTLATRIDVSQ